MDPMLDIKLVGKNKHRGTIILKKIPHCLWSLWPQRLKQSSTKHKLGKKRKPSISLGVHLLKPHVSSLVRTPQAPLNPQFMSLSFYNNQQLKH
jgi:hypothetical protein